MIQNWSPPSSLSFYDPLTRGGGGGGGACGVGGTAGLGPCLRVLPLLALAALRALTSRSFLTEVLARPLGSGLVLLIQASLHCQLDFFLHEIKA